MSRRLQRTTLSLLSTNRGSHARISHRCYSSSSQGFVLPEMELAKKYIASEEWTRSLTYLSRALEIYKQFMKPEEVTQLIELYSYASIKDSPTKAIPLIKQLEQDYAKRGDHLNQWRNIENHIIAERIAGHFQTSIQLAEDAESTLKQNSFFDQLTNLSFLIKIALQRASNFIFLGEKEKSLKSISESKELSQQLPEGNPIRSLVSYHVAKYTFPPSSDLSESIQILEDCDQQLSSLASSSTATSTDTSSSPSSHYLSFPAFPSHSQQILHARVYDALSELLNRQERYRDSEELCKKSLEITNKAVSRDSKVVFWCLHNMAHALVGQQKYLYAEGLYRRILGIVQTKELVINRTKRSNETAGGGGSESARGGGGPFLYDVEVESLKKYCEVLTKFHRKSESEDITSMLGRFDNQDKRPTLLMDALFEDYCFVVDEQLIKK